MIDEEHDSGEETESVCSDCGAPLYSSSSRSYSLGDSGDLCWSCAIRRGGSYDAEEERWVTPPSADDLRRPWSPR